MSEHTIEAEVTVSDWDEEPYPKADEMPKVSAATWKTTYTGGLTGTGVVRALLTYTGGDGSDPASLEADFVSYETIEATVDGESGTFVVRGLGGHGADGAKAEGTIVAGSGTGAFAGASGTQAGTATAMTYPVTFTLSS